MRGDAAAALRILDAAVQQWPDNAGARYLAGFAALQTGQTDRAVSQLREAQRADPGGTDAALLLARIYFERADYDEAGRFARAYVRRRARDQPEGYVLWARAFEMQGETERARNVIDQMEEGGLPMEAAVERAALERKAAGPSAALAAIEGAELDLTDPANEPALRSLVEDLLALGRGKQAMARVEAALAAHPDASAVHVLKARLHALRDESDAAGQAFAKARELDPGLGQTLAGRAALAAMLGERERAVQLFDDAARANPEDPAAAYAAAQLVLAAGQEAEAEQRLGEIVSRHPGAAGARNDLAWLLADSQRELDRALELAQEAARLDPQPAVVDTLGYVHLKRGEGAQAAEAFRRSLQAEPNAPSIRYRLGLALVQTGDSEGARAAFQQALRGGPFPESKAAERELARLAQP
jgi:tetratricopeptide (TPR) repeat protein